MIEEDKAKVSAALSTYIKNRHTQEECSGFIDGYNAAHDKLKSLSLTTDDAFKVKKNNSQIFDTIIGFFCWLLFYGAVLYFVLY